MPARVYLLLASVLLGACATPSQRTGRSAELRLDTETSGRLRHASLRSATGPVTSSTTRAVASHLALLVPALASVLKDADAVSELELRLIECARRAEHEVNAPRFGNRAPTGDECRAKVGVDRCGRPITQAMELGRLKHAVALACTREVLAQLWPAPFSIEQRYRYYPNANVIETVSPAEEQRLIDEDCTGELWRTIKPDVVLHADYNLLRAVLILDFKFPCPVATNEPLWTRYGKGSAYRGSNQKAIYQEALGGEALLISIKGITP
jgi:hypothetical protein